MSPALTHPIRAKHTKGYSVHVLPKIFDVNAKGASILKLSQLFPNKIFHDAYFDQKRAAIIECFFFCLLIIISPETLTYSLYMSCMVMVLPY